MKQFLVLVLGLIFLSIFAVKVNAATTDPQLFSCQNPSGTLVVEQTGVHGIAGDSARYEGTDLVYKINDEYVLQCFCPKEGDEGIQSNWWKVPGISEHAKDFFQRRGWIFISSGEAWGLQADKYLVKNESFSCTGKGVGGGRILGANTLAGTGDPGAFFVSLTAGLGFAQVAYFLSKV